MTKSTSLALLLPVFLSSAGFAPDAKKPTPKPAATPAAATNSCATCKERRPTLEPARFAKLDPEIRQGYQIAREIPATLDKIHCFCECAESPMFRHKTLLTCYTDLHAAGCGICLSEAKLAYDLKAKGLSDEEIVNTVESVHKTDGHPATH
jgi:alkylhydroperoxidase family enzyme